MSQFYGIVSGMARTQGTRRGNATSGIETHASSWEIGIMARVYWNKDKQQEIAQVFLTSGSGGNHPSKLLGEFTVEDLAPDVLVQVRKYKRLP